MIGIYVLERKEGKIQRSYMLTEPSFSPMLEVSEEFTLETINPNGYIIMPTTYEVIKILREFVNHNFFSQNYKEHLLLQ